MGIIVIFVAVFPTARGDPDPTDASNGRWGSFQGGDMETTRLRSIQPPKTVDRLLESFVIGTSRVPPDAYQLRTASALPHHALNSAAHQAQQKDRAWCAWTDDKRTWLFTAEMSLALSREHGIPVLEIRAYSEQGGLEATGFWAHDKQGIWQSCAD
jgi:hypothetical protein